MRFVRRLLFKHAHTRHTHTQTRADAKDVDARVDVFGRQLAAHERQRRLGHAVGEAEAGERGDAAADARDVDDLAAGRARAHARQQRLCQPQRADRVYLFWWGGGRRCFVFVCLFVCLFGL